MDNTLFQSLDRKTTLTEDAEIISASLDMLTSAIIGKLIAERLIAYDGQPGQAIEYAALAVADAIVQTLPLVDSIELKRLKEKRGCHS